MRSMVEGECRTEVPLRQGVRPATTPCRGGFFDRSGTFAPPKRVRQDEENLPYPSHFATEMRWTGP